MQAGQTALYPPVEMIFNPLLNQLDYQFSPAEIPQQTTWRVEAIALKVVKDLKTPGIFAVELFIDKNGDVLVNETAPRVHNSGHHTIEANFSSQFDMLWRIMLGYPLGNPKHIVPAAMVNLIGSEGYSGEAYYEGIDEILKMENIFLHLYGKKETRPGRKMGHITILSPGKKRPRLQSKSHQTKITHYLTSTPNNSMNQVAIIMGSDSDLPVMQPAADLLKSFGIPFELTIVSAHRTPQRLVSYATKAKERGFKVIIAGAGGAAHLPGMVASLTSLPVIGVPIKSSNSLDGWDSILSILQMPNGIPVATVL